jgi:hypothetical protein
VLPWSVTTRQSDLVFPVLQFVECQLEGVDQRQVDCGRRGATKLLVTCVLIPKIKMQVILTRLKDTVLITDTAPPTADGSCRQGGYP